MSDPVIVTDNADASRLEIHAGGEVAELAYRTRPGRLVLIHTEVPDSLGGRGFGGQLVLGAIGKAVHEGLTVVPLCPFAHSWLKRHPDDAARVKIDWADPDGGLRHGPGPARRTRTLRAARGRPRLLAALSRTDIHRPARADVRCASSWPGG